MRRATATGTLAARVERANRTYMDNAVENPRRHARRTAHRVPRALVLAFAFAFIACSAPAAAHEKWFYDTASHPLRWDLFFTPIPLGFASLALVVTIAAALVWRARGRRGFVPGPSVLGATSERLQLVYGILPLIIGVHAAVPLLVAGTHTVLFSPNEKLFGLPAYVLGLVETFVALSLFYGGLTRLAAIALGLAWLTSFAIVGPEGTLENVMYLGLACFFFFAGRGPISIDRVLFPKLEPSRASIARAVVPLRVGLGASLVVVAFTEKFANLPLALDFLHKYPLNFTHALGIPLPDEIFVLCAATVELVVGLWIALGIFNREIIIVAWLPFNLTLSVFDATELIGHLPIYGIMALLLIWDHTARNREDWVEGVAGRADPSRATKLHEAA